jgi:hypothetical protein
MQADQIYDASGHQIGRTQGLRRFQMIVNFFFFV